MIGNKQWWIISLGVPLGLVAVRMVITHSWQFGFYFWNLFLAFLPLFASYRLDSRSSLLKTRNLVSMAVWFLFLPNAPYLITDMVHFQAASHVPIYLDEAIVFSATWTGMLMGYASIMKVEQWLLLRYRDRPVRIALICVFLLTGLGIYLGRYLRWNSWDMLIHPWGLTKDIGIRVLDPIRYKSTWAVSLLYGGVFMIGYYALRMLGLEIKPKREI